MVTNNLNQNPNPKTNLINPKQMNLLKKLAAAIALSLIVVSLAFAYTSPGSPTGYINDFAKILDSTWIQTENTALKTFETKTGAEFAVVTVPSLGGDTVENYAVKLFEEWGIGKKGKDNGILILISQADRAVRIEVGYGLEGTITDADSNRIIQNQMIPNLKASNPAGAITNAISEIETKITGEPSNISPTSSQTLPYASTPITHTNTKDVSSGFGIVISNFAMIFGVFIAAAVGVRENAKNKKDKTNKDKSKKKRKLWWVIILLALIIGTISMLLQGGDLLDFLSRTFINLVLYIFVYHAVGNVGPGGGKFGGHSGGFGSSSGGSFGGGSSGGSFGGGRSGGGGASGSW